MRGRLICAACVWVLDSGPYAAAGQSAPSPGLDVCIVASEGLALDAGERSVVLAEANTIWNPFGVYIRWTGASDENCHRKILVKANTEARPGEAAHEAALGWVPFVEGRARRLVFLRLDRARRLIAGLGRGPRTEESNRVRFATLIGRGLAHELGHVLLNSRTHSASGLMRARYRPDDVLRTRARAYTLTPPERAELLARLGGETRPASR